MIYYEFPDIAFIVLSDPGACFLSLPAATSCGISFDMPSEFNKQTVSGAKSSPNANTRAFYECFKAFCVKRFFALMLTCCIG
jgi:hypothetical protein